MPEWHSRKELRRVAMEEMGHNDTTRIAIQKLEPIVNEIWEETQSPTYFEWYDSPMYAYSCLDCFCDFTKKNVQAFAGWLNEYTTPAARDLLTSTRAETLGVKNVLDSGAGIGASTRLMSELCPTLKLSYGYYTNGDQTRVATTLFEDMRHPPDWRWEGAAHLSSWPYNNAHWTAHPNAVMLFEVLEHEKRPFEKLRPYLESKHCKVICMANSFTQAGDLGHWREYEFVTKREKWGEVQGIHITQRKETSRYLHKQMKEAGWKPEDTGFWNGAPQIWTRA